MSANFLHCKGTVILFVTDKYWEIYFEIPSPSAHTLFLSKIK